MSVDPLFSSTAGGSPLRQRLMDSITEAAWLARTHDVDLHVMTFSFTDAKIADALTSAALQPRLTLRLISDWTQRAADDNQQVGRLARLGLPNLEVRYKKDHPYVWDDAAGRIRWSYRASQGLLHHKTLSTVVDGRPSRLVCGSFNWTARAARSYENVLTVTDSSEGCRDLLTRMEDEFHALWVDDEATVSHADADAYYEAIAEQTRETHRAPNTFIKEMPIRPDKLRILSTRASTPAAREDIVIAFSAPPLDGDVRAGHAQSNRERALDLCTPGGRTKRVRLDITTLALDLIYRAAPGETLLVAMHALSPRVPEYGALIDAARRGVHLRVLLDGKVGERATEGLLRVRERDQIPIEIKCGGKVMHQKYVVNVDSAAVITGTANMSTDASMRHSEHRIRLFGDRHLADQFVLDFEAIWNRVGDQKDRARDKGLASR